MMNCSEWESLLDSYFDQRLSAQQQTAFLLHSDNCVACGKKLAEMEVIIKSLRDLDEVELPSDFSADLHQRLMAVQDEQLDKAVPFYRKRWVKVLSSLAACLVLFLALGTVFAVSNLFVGDDYKTAVPERESNASSPAAPPLVQSESQVMKDTVSGQVPGADDVNSSMSIGGTALAARSNQPTVVRKVIYNARLGLEVRDFDVAMEAINALAAEHGGYIVSSNVQNSDAYEDGFCSGDVVFRVDSTQLEQVLGQIDALGKRMYKDVEGNDITTEYYDIQARLKQYQLQESRLLELMGKTENVADLLKVESELSRIRSEIESLTGSLRYYNELTALSTITVELSTASMVSSRVTVAGWHNLGQKIQEGFITCLNLIINGIGSIIIFIAFLIPFLILLTIGILVVVFLLHRRRKKKTVQ